MVSRTPVCRWGVPVLTKNGDGINPRGATYRNEQRRDRAGQERNTRYAERNWIVGPDAIEHSTKGSGDEHDPNRPTNQTKRHPGTALP